jgi:ATP-dependent helicase/nuclease subunit A
MPAKFPLSKEQVIASKTFGAELGVSASAGSGKTTVLVERYLEAVRKGAWPDSILAVTFTDKAAGVMKDRLRRRARESGLVELGRRLDGGWIGTIHSFCARFLKENPIEAGVDPLFKVLGRGEQEMVMNAVIDDLFELEASNELFIAMLTDMNEDNLRAALKDFYDKLRAYAGDKELLRFDTGEKKRLELERDLAAACERYSDTGKNASAPEEKLAAVCRLAVEVLQGKTQGWERRTALLSAFEDLKANSPKTKEAVYELRGLAEGWSSAVVQTLAHPYKNEWRRLAAKFTEAYDAEKRRLAAHDFDDLLFFTWRALSGTTVECRALRKRTQERFKFVFVDEFQDTSVLQAKILDLLKRPGNLFVVGDVRQSIYKFRHAHPEIFLETLARSKPLSLTENYRSRPEILELVNRVFRTVFEHYEPLKSKRRFLIKKHEALEWLAVPKNERTLEEARVTEARSVAARVRALVDSGFQVEEGGRPRPVRWRDIALLLRKSTNSRVYEKELESLGVPFYVNKGRGFYEKTEVSDVVNLLKLIENPSENVAAAAVLRSPLVQISDDALYWLSRKRLAEKPERALHWALLHHEEVKELSAEDRARIADFLMLLARLRAEKDRVKLSALVQDALVSVSYEAKLLARPNGRQALANVRKLVEMAAAVEDKSVRGISDFILYLESASESSETESEARMVGEEEDVLRILTVHAAKGLEFPVVVLADLGSEGGQPFHPAFRCSAKEGLGARLKDPDTLEYCEDTVYAAIKAEEKKKEDEESDRILYVALTRAEEHLILSGVNEGSVMKRLGDALADGRSKFTYVGIVDGKPEAPKPAPRLVDSLPASADEKIWKAIEERLAPIEKAYESLEDLTVSRLREAAAPKDAFEAELEPKEAKEEETEDATPRNEYGTIFHFLMESAARQTPRGQLPAERLASVTAPLTAPERKEIEASFTAFWKGALGASVKRSSKCYPELPFIYKTRHGLLKGQIDLVYREKNGSWTIVDYKTNRLLKPGDKERAVTVYKTQMALYALAFWKLHGHRPEKAVLYFAATDETAEFTWSQTELEGMAGELDGWFRKALDFS